MRITSQSKWIALLMKSKWIVLLMKSKWIALLMKNYEKIRGEGAKIFMGTSDFAIEEE